MKKEFIGKASACALALSLSLASAALPPAHALADEGGGWEAASTVQMQVQSGEATVAGTWGTCPWELYRMAPSPYIQVRVPSKAGTRPQKIPGMVQALGWTMQALSNA